MKDARKAVVYSYRDILTFKDPVIETSFIYMVWISKQVVCLYVNDNYHLPKLIPLSTFFPFISIFFLNGKYTQLYNSSQ